MNHVHWWLVAVAFVTGLVFTLALMVRPIRSEVPVETSEELGEAGTESEHSTTKIPVAKEHPTTKIPVAKEHPTTKIPVAKEHPTAKIPVAKEHPTAKIPVTEKTPKPKISVPTETPTTKIPVTEREPEMEPIAEEEEHPTTKIPVATPTTKIPVVSSFAPYGPGSARADADGGGPSGWLVKGRSDTRLYYTSDDTTYDQTTAQVWFKDEESAAQAFFTPWRKSKKK
jgi:uncharacterized membrane protein ArfC